MAVVVSIFESAEFCLFVMAVEVFWHPDINMTTAKQRIMSLEYVLIVFLIDSFLVCSYDGKKIGKLLSSRPHIWDSFEDICFEAKKNGIRLILPKGFSISLLLYEDKFMRPAGDIDLLVDKDDVDILCSILREKGFFHRRDDNICNLLDVFGSNKFANFYEIKYLKNINGKVIWADAFCGAQRT